MFDCESLYGYCTYGSSCSFLSSRAHLQPHPPSPYLSTNTKNISLKVQIRVSSIFFKMQVLYLYLPYLCCSQLLVVASNERYQQMIRLVISNRDAEGVLDRRSCYITLRMIFIIIRRRFQIIKIFQTFRRFNFKKTCKDFFNSFQISKTF